MILGFGGGPEIENSVGFGAPDINHTFTLANKISLSLVPPEPSGYLTGNPTASRS